MIWGVSSPSQIQPIFIGESDKACRIQALLRDKKIHVVAIRPPTVPMNQALLRVSLTSAHSKQDIDFLFNELERIV